MFGHGLFARRFSGAFDDRFRCREFDLHFGRPYFGRRHDRRFARRRFPPAGFGAGASGAGASGAGASGAGASGAGASVRALQARALQARVPALQRWAVSALMVATSGSFWKSHLPAKAQRPAFRHQAPAARRCRSGRFGRSFAWSDDRADAGRWFDREF